MDTLRWIPGVCFLKLGEIATDAGMAINDDSPGFCLQWFAASPFMLVGFLSLYTGYKIAGEQGAYTARYAYIQRLLTR